MTVLCGGVPDTLTSAPPPQGAGTGSGAGTRLDNTMNKSDRILDERVRGIKVKAKFNNTWADDRVLVSKDGEILCDDEGNPLTLKEMSKSWYCEAGGRNNAKAITRRLQLAHGHPADVKRYRPKFVTLTFADVVESWEAERAIQKFTDNLRKYAKRHGGDTLAYFWSAEVQKRGALHYHVLILGLPYLPKELVKVWWPYGFVDVRAVDDIGRAFKYLAKYCWKWGKLASEPDSLPDWWFFFSVFSKRRYGFSRWFTLPPLQRIPRWLREFFEDQGIEECLLKAKRAVGGGWLLLLERPGMQVELHFPSPYRIWARGA